MAATEQGRSWSGSRPVTDRGDASEATEEQQSPAARPEPEFDNPPDSVGKRLLKPQTLISFLIAIGFIAFLITKLDINLDAVWTNVRNANPYMLLSAFALYYATFVLRAYRWRWMLSQAGINRANGYPIPGIPRLTEILLLSWFVNCIVPAKLGDGYRCYLLKQDTGASFSATLGTLMAERLTDLVVLFITMSVAGVIAFHGNLPEKVTQTMIIGVVLISIGMLAVVAMGVGRNRFRRFVPPRFHDQFELFASAIFACLRSPFVPIAISMVIWAMDGFRFYLVLRRSAPDFRSSWRSSWR